MWAICFVFSFFGTVSASDETYRSSVNQVAPRLHGGIHPKEILKEIFPLRVSLGCTPPRADGGVQLDLLNFGKVFPGLENALRAKLATVTHGLRSKQTPGLIRANFISSFYEIIIRINNVRDGPNLSKNLAFSCKREG